MVNDASNDGFDYEGLSDRYHVRKYVRHKTRRGSGPSKQEGIRLCKTPFFLVIDAHMRFYDDGWWRRIPEAVRTDENAIYCCVCKPWDAETKTERQNNLDKGAYLVVLNESTHQILDIKWNYMPLPYGETISDIPCILGACYAGTKKYWHYLNGYQGLKKYGCEEAFLSIKAWASGGRCRIIRDIKIGHLFRNAFPYSVKDSEFTFNKYVISFLTMPESVKNKINVALRCSDMVGYYQAKNLIDNDIYYQKLRSHQMLINTSAGMDRFIKINDRFLDFNIRYREENGLTQ